MYKDQIERVLEDCFHAAIGPTRDAAEKIMAIDSDRIKYIPIAAYLYKNLGWAIGDGELCMSEFEKYCMVRDAIDGLFMAIGYMQKGIDAGDESDFKPQADVIADDLEAERRNKKKDSK